MLEFPIQTLTGLGIGESIDSLLEEQLDDGEHGEDGEQLVLVPWGS